MEQIEARKEALKDNFDRENKLYQFHVFVYSKMNSDETGKVISKAMERIALWEKDNLCSKYYINSWRNILSKSDINVFKSVILDNSSGKSSALMQNTPFSFLIREWSEAEDLKYLK